VRGQLAWHRHDDEDELFQVVRGRLRIQFEGGAEADPVASNKGCCHASSPNTCVSNVSNPASLPSTIPHTSRLSTVA